ncbi:MAG: TAXI family TRAP transporter solute-binding subunit [Verrucomicrobia subdivision 3 bacterium]|nr:TAXI family TRAP transporter solute-binding subunit [Limisphaerales bacterium]
MGTESIRNRLIAVGLLIVLAVGLTARHWFTPDETTLIFATGQRGGLYHELGQAIADEVQQAHPHLRIQLVETTGSLDNANRLRKQTIHLALLQNDTQAGAHVRSLTAIHPELLHFLCHREAGIGSLRDLVGKTVALGPKGSGSEKFTREFLRFAGFNESQLTLVNLPLKEATSQLIAGNVHALLFLSGLDNDAFKSALQSGQVRLTPLIPLTHSTSISPNNLGDANDEARALVDGFRVHYPNASAHTIPLLAYPGQPIQPIGTVGVKAVLACHPSLPNEIAELITRTLYGHRAALSQKHSTFSSLDEQTSTTHLQFPLHPGAEHYFQRTDPGFFEKYVEIMSFILTLILILWSVIIWAQRWFLQRRKNRIDTYYEEIDKVINRLHDGTDLEEINKLETQLLKIRQRALAELVKEKLAADESYIIYQNMLNGCESMLVRLREKIQASSEKDA